MTTLVVHPCRKPLAGSVPVPSDKSIGHRALLFGALATGESRISGFSYGEDNVSTAAALRAMGVTIHDDGAGNLRVEGAGLRGLRAPAHALDCGNSGTTMRLLAGILAAQPFTSTLVGDASLSKRPMLRVVAPLRARGARLVGRPHPRGEGELTAPLEIGPLEDGTCLGPLEYESPVASAQVKSALLLSGLYASGTTFVREPSVSRDHTERMLSALGVPIETVGAIVKLDPNGWDGAIRPLSIDIPGDLSAAAFPLVAALVVPGSHVTVRGVGVNPSRTGILEMARDMGATLLLESKGDRAGEPIAELTAVFGPLGGRRIGGETVTRGIDEVPIVCALAARAVGTTEIRDARELRVKESDRIKVMADVLRAFGVPCTEQPDGLTITGTNAPLTPAHVDSHGDHRIAMTAAVLGLCGSGPSRITSAECIATSYPKFVATLRGLGAEIEVMS